MWLILRKELYRLRVCLVYIARKLCRWWFNILQQLILIALYLYDSWFICSLFEQIKLMVQKDLSSLKPVIIKRNARLTWSQAWASHPSFIHIPNLWKIEPLFPLRRILVSWSLGREKRLFLKCQSWFAKHHFWYIYLQIKS